MNKKIKILEQPKKMELLTLKINKMEWIYIIAGIMIALFFTGLLFGCSVVKTDYSPIAKKNATVYYYLPESLLKIKAVAKVAVVYNADDSTLNASSRVMEQSFAITTEMVADTKDLLSLNYKPSAFMADEIKYNVNTKGLLETVSITTEDKSADIISKLAEAPQVVLGISAGATKAPNTIVKIKEYTWDIAVKASSISSTPLGINWNILVVNELGKDEFITIAADYKISSPDIAPVATTLANLIHGGATSQQTEINGILTRPLKNVQIVIEPATAGYNSALPTNIVIADVSKIVVVPVKRTAFVKRVNKIGIQDGLILSNEINKPSSVEGFISIPINITKAIVSIPGQLVQFKFDNTKRLDNLEQAKLSYEKSLQESKKYALTKEQEIENIKLGIQKTELSNQVELQKLKLDLQKSLLDAETKQLESQKALDALKKELEKHKKDK